MFEILYNIDFKFKPKFHSEYRWVQFPISSDGAIHYEISFYKRGVIISIHFEKKWIEFSYILKNATLICSTVNLDCNFDRGQAYFVIEKSNDKIQIIKKSCDIINQTYKYISNVISSL